MCDFYKHARGKNSNRGCSYLSRRCCLNHSLHWDTFVVVLDPPEARRITSDHSETENTAAVCSEK